MKRILMLLLVCALCPMLAVQGAEKKKTKKTPAPATKVEQNPQGKPEQGNEGETGKITGTITKIDGGRVTIKGAEKTLTVMPYWQGGSPKAGGGFDKGVMRQLEAFKVGDKVTVGWKFAEHYRIEQIAKAE
jgi:ribosomal protein L21E